MSQQVRQEAMNCYDQARTRHFESSFIIEIKLPISKSLRKHVLPRLAAPPKKDFEPTESLMIFKPRNSTLLSVFSPPRAAYGQASTNDKTFCGLLVLPCVGSKPDEELCDRNVLIVLSRLMCSNTREDGLHSHFQTSMLEKTQSTSQVNCAVGWIKEEIERADKLIQDRT